MGTPLFAVPVLKKLVENTQVVLVVTQPDKLVGRKQNITKSPVKVEAERNNIPVFQPTKIRNDYEFILKTEADIIITCAYGQIIPESILEYPQCGCINVHASLLPKYRGGAPIHWCLINGEEKTGITIMYMDKEMDTGDIISQREYSIKKTDNVGTLHEILADMGASLLIETLPSIINKTNKRLKQNNDEASYAFNIKREDELLDFSLSGKEIINKIRGLNPWPLAYFKLDNLEIKVLEASFKTETVKEVGVIEKISKKSLGISCRDGIIYLEKIKPFGKKIMNIGDYLNGQREELQNKRVNR